MEGLTCTCRDWTEEWQHHHSCELWESDGFVSGELMWDCDTEKLVQGDYWDEGWIKASQDDEEEDEVVVLEEEAEVIEEVTGEEDWLEWEASDLQLLEEFAESLHSRKVMEGKNQFPFYACNCTVKKQWYCDVCGVMRCNDGKGPWVPIEKRRSLEEEMWRQGLIYDCTHPEKTKGTMCLDCEVQRMTNYDPWTYLDSEIYLDTWMDDSALPSGGTGGTPLAKGTTYFQKCRHYGQEVVLPDGTKIQCSSQFERKSKEEIATRPDFGVYLASSWHPGRLCFYLDWQDFGLPQVPWTDVRHAALEMVRLAKEGKRVETGCMGGHGRTGTFLACIVMLTSDLKPEAAMKYVWDNYCKEAIEGDLQEWYVEAFYAWHNGLEAPPQPKPKPVTYTAAPSTGACPIPDHKKLWFEGKECSKNGGKPCTWWNADAKNNEAQYHQNGRCNAGSQCKRHAKADSPHTDFVQVARKVLETAGLVDKAPPSDGHVHEVAQYQQYRKGELWEVTEWSDGVKTLHTVDGKKSEIENPAGV